MLNRLKRIWQLSKKDPKKLAELTDEQIDKLPEAGNGKAEFLGVGTEEEFLEQENEDKFGFKKLFKP